MPPFFATSYLTSISASFPFLNSTTRLTAPTWPTPSQSSLPQQSTLDVFMVLFVSIFLFLIAAVLRLMPTDTSSVSTTRLHRRHREIDRLASFSPFTYGAVENITHVQALSNSTPPTYEALIDLQDQIGQAKNGLTDDQIDILPTYACDQIHDQQQLDRRGQTCAICRDKFSNGESLTLLPCGDEYHSECIKPWLKQQATCPLCRSRFA